MSETDTEDKPFRYARTFQATSKEIPLAEMDKDAIENYINGLLSAKNPKAKISGPQSK